MKNGVILVNTSRGGLIEETAAGSSGKRKSRDGRFGCADAVDTDYAQSPLLTYADRVIITPHIGWYSEESIVELQKKQRRMCTALKTASRCMRSKLFYLFKGACCKNQHSGQFEESTDGGATR